MDIQGPESSGKTTLAQHAANSLEDDEDALWISMGTGIPTRAVNAALVTPRSAEEAFVLMVEALSAGASLVVLDSASGLVRYQELIDPDYVPDSHREFKFELDQVRQACRRTNGVVMFLSRPRENSPGLRGTGISEKAQQRVRLKVIELRQSGRRRVTTTGGADFWINPGSGIDWTEDLARTAFEMDLIKREGSWWYMPGTRDKCMGIESTKVYLHENPEYSLELSKHVMNEARERFNW